MAKIDVRFDDPPTAYGFAVQFVRDLYDESERLKGVAEGADQSMNWVIETGNRYGTETPRKYARMLNRLRNTPGIDQYAKDITGDQTYEFESLLNDLRLQCRALQDACFAIVPKDAQDKILGYTLANDLSISTQTITVAELATLPPIFQGILDLIDRGLIETSGTSRITRRS